jgi:GNAT superfamily N-acetyltransferase
MLEIRPCADEADLEASMTIYNAVFPWEAVTMDEVRSFISQTLDYGDFVGSGGSVAVGVMPQRPDVAFVMLAVLPDHRRRGVGTALYQEVSTWLAERDVHRMDVPVHEDDEDAIAFAERRGFQEVERNRRMILDLTTLEPPALDPPSGIEILSWAERTELAQGIYEVACEAFPDIPGSEDELMEPFADWLAHHMQGSGDLPEATFLALAGSEVVGYAKFSLTAAKPTTATHDVTGVKRAWRGRGIAGALKRAQITWAKEQGYERLATQNELRNEPIRRLNERLGYREAPGRVMMRGPLSPNAGS